MQRGSVDSSESPLDFGNRSNDSYYFEESPEGSINIDDEPYTDDEQDHDAEPAGTTRSMKNNRKLRLGVVIYHRPCSKIIGNGRFLLKKWDKFSLYFMLYAISILLYLLTNVLTIFYFYCTNNKIELAYNIPYLVMLFGVSMLSFNAELKSTIKSIPVQSSGRPSSSETFEQTARIFLYLQTFSSFSITFKDHLSRLLKFF